MTEIVVEMALSHCELSARTGIAANVPPPEFISQKIDKTRHAFHEIPASRRSEIRYANRRNVDSYLVDPTWWSGWRFIWAAEGMWVEERNGE